MRPPVAGQDWDYVYDEPIHPAGHGMPEWWPLEEVAAAIGRPYKTVHDWARRGLVSRTVIRGVVMVATIEVVRVHLECAERPKRRGKRAALTAATEREE